MSRGFATILAVFVGGFVGLVVGVVSWVGIAYLVFCLPHGESLRHLDQAAIPVVFTGPLGAIIGAIVAPIWVRRRMARREQ